MSLNPCAYIYDHGRCYLTRCLSLVMQGFRVSSSKSHYFLLSCSIPLKTNLNYLFLATIISNFFKCYLLVFCLYKKSIFSYICYLFCFLLLLISEILYYFLPFLIFPRSLHIAFFISSSNIIFT